jgi:hypothetical protein
MYDSDQKAVLHRFNERLRWRGDKLTIGTVSHVVQSPDSDSNALFMVIETTVHANPSGWGWKRSKDLISSLKHWSPTNM